jgi:hypothetical protein
MARRISSDNGAPYFPDRRLKYKFDGWDSQGKRVPVQPIEDGKLNPFQPLLPAPGVF